MASLTNRLNTFLLIMLMLMAAAIIAILATRASAGPLDPPGTPAPTGRSLLFQPASCAGFPISISQPGSYALASNIVLPGGCTFKNGINVNASGVTLDLAGFSVIGLASNSGSGIVAGGSTANLRVTNGMVNTWSGDAVDFTNASNSEIDHVIASGGSSASAFGIGSMTTLSDCQATGSFNGVAMLGSYSVVKGCLLKGNAARGVFIGTSAAENVIEDNALAEDSVGVYVQGSQNVIKDNTVAQASFGELYEVTATGSWNQLYNNTSNFTTFGVSGLDGGSLDDIGPFATAATATNPSTNIFR